MIIEEKAEFGVTIGAMMETFGVEATKAILHGYWLGLNDLSLQQVQLAVAKAIRTCKHAPKPAELRELAGCGKENTEDLAFRAWSEALDAVSNGPYRHVDFEDKCVNAVIRSMGGWPTFVARFTDGESEKWARLDFVKLYKCYAARPVSDEATAPLPGLSEFESNSIDRKPVPVRIKCKDAPRLALANRLSETAAIPFRKV